MSIIILSEFRKAYATVRLVESFAKLDLPVSVYNPNKFDVIVGKGLALYHKGQEIDNPKLVLTRTGSGTTDFITSVIKQFEQNNIACINSSTSINLAKDKLGSSQLFANNGLPIPKTMLVKFPVDAELVETVIGYPCVVKVVTGSHGDGMYLCDNKKSFTKIMEFVNKLDTNKTLIVQEYIDTRPGEDLRVFVIGDKVIGAMKRFAPVGDFRANISNGGHGEPFAVNSDIEYLAREAARICGLDIAGIDLLFDKNGYKICEANSNPGFEGFDKYCNTDIALQIAEYIKYKHN